MPVVARCSLFDAPQASRPSDVPRPDTSHQPPRAGSVTRRAGAQRRSAPALEGAEQGGRLGEVVGEIATPLTSK